MANDKIEKKVKKEKKHFFKDFKAELKKVTWPTGKQLVNNTVAVITIVFITALIVFVLDLGFEALTKNGINGIKAATKKNETTVVEQGNTQTNTDEPTAETTENTESSETTEATETAETTEATPEVAE